MKQIKIDKHIVCNKTLSAQHKYALLTVKFLTYTYYTDFSYNLSIKNVDFFFIIDSI